MGLAANTKNRTASAAGVGAIVAENLTAKDAIGIDGLAPEKQHSRDATAESVNESVNENQDFKVGRSRARVRLADMGTDKNASSHV